MLISPQTAQGLLADLTQACGLPVAPEELGHCRFTVGDHVFIGDFPLRGYKHKGRWRLDDREVQQAGRALVQLPFDPHDLVDTKLPVRRPDSDTYDDTDWRRMLLRWMRSAAFKETWDNGCPCGPRTEEGRGCRRREGLQDNGLPCGLAMDQLKQRYGRQTIAGTRPLDVLAWDQDRKKWLAPRAYVALLDRWATARDTVDDKARQCSGCGKTTDDRWGWRSPTRNGWITLCPRCTSTSHQKYAGHLHGTQYDSLSRLVRADGYLCQLCSEPRRASHWDHCHDHGYVRGPLCASCNTYESLGTDFLSVTAGLAHLLECRGCRLQRTLPQHHRAAVVRKHLEMTERHDRCRQPPRVREENEAVDGTVRFVLGCYAHPQEKRWEQVLSGSTITELVREFVDRSLTNP
ncbi:endonuclease domain-containing protein [Streptomyces platensis]|uniref:endonuclease domain-containing protein n=1 Tax=Streptomyces platensis TaxID=58346 RepID=UPI0037A2E8AD